MSTTTAADDHLCMLDLSLRTRSVVKDPYTKGVACFESDCLLINWDMEVCQTNATLIATLHILKHTPASLANNLDPLLLTSPLICEIM